MKLKLLISNLDVMHFNNKYKIDALNLKHLIIIPREWIDSIEAKDQRRT